ncbi:hypothetical protein BDY19DRAFT_345051 [Irpex rosettiformis]|uniref:Uncharacterized protein n=1 Tax=Irpex rosettiformis TaxID=378272 RepID=A0ACB8TWM1_9APHY|nr:hypothetical protein BDY19DRAFT_345051 [Irpex rosettiformis]
MVDDSLLPPTIALKTHDLARQKACATQTLFPGTCVVTVEALETALLPSEKGQRCDFCLCRPLEAKRLARCSGCAEFWYCGPICQKMQWNKHHRRICKRYNRYLASQEYQSLSISERVDSALLSHLAAATLSPESDRVGLQAKLSAPALVFFDLMKGPVVNRRSLPLVGLDSSNRTFVEGAEDMYSRFGNNNFIVHSHLNSCAHGIFPLASRLFNHSCDPNCVAKYRFTRGKPVIMEVVAISTIAMSEELTIPYLDPALPFQTRQEALSVNYGFRCSCSVCTFQKNVSAPPPHANLETELCDFVDSHIIPLYPSQDSKMEQGDTIGTRRSLPDRLYPVLHADYLPGLAEEFSRASHEGEYDRALASGRTLLALYFVLYPPYYPQIGMHALEITKTAWNAVVTCEQEHGDNVVRVTEYEKLARFYYNVTVGVIELLGPEGDEGGPLEELHVMRSLLQP